MEYDDAPIGIFDSGFGGLTVAREIIKALPEESIIFSEIEPVVLMGHEILKKLKALF